MPGGTGVGTCFTGLEKILEFGVFESFLVLTGICAAVYLVWFFLPKIFDSGGGRPRAEEYAWLVVGLFFLPVSTFFGVLTGFFFLFWLSAPASVDFLWWLIIAVPMTLIPGLVVGYSAWRIYRAREKSA